MTHSRAPHSPSGKSWALGDGKWGLIDDPVRLSEGSTFAGAVRAAGYRRWLETGRSFEAPTGVTVWMRKEAPSYMVALWGSEVSKMVFAQTFPDALELLSQVAPIMQTLSATRQVKQAGFESAR